MTRIIRQDDVDFSVAHKVQTTWGLQEAITFALEGIGATLLFAGLVAGYWVAALAGLVVLLASGLLLMAHLGNPKNIIFLLANIRHSWMSRGAALIPLYMVLGFAVVAAGAVFEVSADGGLGLALDGLFALLTLFVLLKSGLVMTTFPGISFWNGRLLPVLFALNGITSGLALFWVLAWDRLAAINWIPPGLYIALLATLALYMVTIGNAGPAAKLSVKLITERHFAEFWGVGVLGGIVGPLLLGLFATLGAEGASPILFGVIAVLRVAGDITLRDVILKVGVYEKVR
jgi:formate-dependent nitrite reductase membrane component NrfD